MFTGNFRSRTRVQFIENMRRIFSGQSGVLGKYRIRETQTTVIGVGEFVEPWFGFAVSQNSDDYEYALEFLRFLAQEDQLNTLASVKGVPSAIKNSSDARYEGIQNAENVAARYVNDGTILNHVKNYFKQTASGLGNGDYATTEDAARDYVQRCAEVAAQMAENS